MEQENKKTFWRRFKDRATRKVEKPVWELGLYDGVIMFLFYCFVTLIVLFACVTTHSYDCPCQICESIQVMRHEYHDDCDCGNTAFDCPFIEENEKVVE